MTNVCAGPSLPSLRIVTDGKAARELPFATSLLIRRDLAQKRSLTRDARHENPVAGQDYGTAANIEINRATFSALLQRGVAVRDISNGTAVPGSTLAMEREVLRQFEYVRSWAGSDFWVPPR
jgi:hypothetical protein